jgi:hypothetical protein
MKKLSFILLVLMVGMAFTSCNDHETYADQKKKERAAISDYIKREGINVISEDDFKAKGNVTDTLKNEYVLFDNTGVYMQIQRKGCGNAIQIGETAEVLCRFYETNLLTDSLQLSNNVQSSSLNFVDKMTVTNSSGSFTASFVSGVMSSVYGTSVPTGWLVPLPYIKVGRPTANEKIAKVKLIVPHDSGQSSATQYVYPCLYEITYERGR